MSSRVLIGNRNHQIKRIWDYFRKVEKRQSDYVLEVLRNNFFLDTGQIYNILNSEDIPAEINYESASYIYKALFIDGHL